MLNLCYYHPEKYANYHLEDTDEGYGMDDVFDDSPDDDDEEEVSGGEEDYDIKKDPDNRREARNALGLNQYSRSARHFNRNSGGADKSREGKKHRAVLAVKKLAKMTFAPLSIHSVITPKSGRKGRGQSQSQSQGKGQKLKRKRYDDSDDDDDDDDDEDEDAEDEYLQDNEDGDEDEDEVEDYDDDNMSVLSGSTNRSRGSAGSRSGPRQSRWRRDKRPKVAASPSDLLSRGECTAEQDAGVIEMFLYKILRREESALPFCLDEGNDDDDDDEYCGPSAIAAQSFEQYSLPGNDILFRDHVNMDLSTIDVSTMSFVDCSDYLFRLSLTNTRAQARLVTLFKLVSSFKTVGQIVAFVVSKIGRRMCVELCSSLNSALDYSLHERRAAVQSGLAPLTSLELYSTSFKAPDDNDNDGGMQVLSTDLPGARSLWYQILRNTDWSEAPKLVAANCEVEPRQYCSTLPRINLSPYSDEALQHVFRMIVGNKWYRLRRKVGGKRLGRPPRGSEPVKAQHWRDILQKLDITPTVYLFRQVCGYLAPLYAAQMALLRLSEVGPSGTSAAANGGQAGKRKCADTDEEPAIKRPLSSSSSSSSILFPTVQLDASSNSATVGEAFSLAHTLAMSSLSSTTWSSDQVQIEIKEDIIVATRASGRPVLVKDKVLEKERELGLYDGPNWQHRAGRRGPKFAREKMLSCATTTTTTSSSSSSSSSAPVDDTCKAVTDSNVGFFSREMNRVSVFVRREQPDAGTKKAVGADDDNEAAKAEQTRVRVRVRVDEAKAEQTIAWEAQCPWLTQHHSTLPIETDGVLVDLLAGKALAFLANFPGSTLAMLHAAMPLLTLQQTACFLCLMERRGLVVTRAADASIVWDPFAWPPATALSPAAVSSAAYFVKNCSI